MLFIRADTGVNWQPKNTMKEMIWDVQHNARFWSQHTETKQKQNKRRMKEGFETNTQTLQYRIPYWISYYLNFHFRKTMWWLTSSYKSDSLGKSRKKTYALCQMKKTPFLQCHRFYPYDSSSLVFTNQVSSTAFTTPPSNLFPSIYHFRQPLHCLPVWPVHMCLPRTPTAQLPLKPVNQYLPCF